MDDFEPTCDEMEPFYDDLEEWERNQVAEDISAGEGEDDLEGQEADDAGFEPDYYEWEYDEIDPYPDSDIEYDR